MSRRRSRSFAITMLLGVACVAAANPDPAQVRLVFNGTASAPMGWFLVKQHAAVRRNDLVLARLPPSAAVLAEARGYLRLGTPVIKRVAATQGQRACAQGSDIRIDGVQVAIALAHDGQGRALMLWQGCRALADEVFLLGDRSPASFDSRYIGPVPRAAIVGRVEPLWTW